MAFGRPSSAQNASERGSLTRFSIPFALAFALLATALIGTSSLRLVGDGHEYVGMSVAILTFGSPSPTPEQLDALEARLARWEVPVLRDALHPGRDGRLHHRHFWLYPALATPLVGAALLAGLHPAWGFTLLNLIALVAAAGIVARRAGALATLLLFAGPIVWWLDKAHPEAVIFALIAAGTALLDEAPAAALIIWGVAAAQYPPLALLLVGGTMAAVVVGPRRRIDRRFVIGLLGALSIAAIHPLHSWWKLGVISPLALWGRPPTLPSWRAWAAVYLDLNIGLLWNVPLLVLAIIALTVANRPATTAMMDESPASRGDQRSRRPIGANGGRRSDEKRNAASGKHSSKPRAGTIVAVIGAALLPVAFAQTVNVNHGGTPGMSRYALWLIPLAVAALALGPGRPARERWVAIPVTTSVLWCLFLYHPVRAERYRAPTPLAAAVWRHAPALSAPLPEIFSERVSHAEPGMLPVSTPSCSKVLLLAGRWPAPCAPAQNVPSACNEPGALCYADRERSRPGAYRFRPLAEPLPAAWAANTAVWPEGIEGRVATLLAGLRWWELTGPAPSAEGPLRAARQVGWTSWLAGEDRFFLYASDPKPGGAVTLRLPTAMSGTIVAAASGARLREIDSPAAGALWTLPLPPTGSPGVIVVLRSPSE